MKTDSYTKVILTIIAICLLLIVAGNGNMMPTANANASDSSKEYVLIPTNPDGSINVRIISTVDNQNVIIAGWKKRPLDGNGRGDIINLTDEGLPVKGRN